ncbi:hypothetical protein WISP_55458 [Willisornis vidua]|uniref:AIG1 protein n=1 Tax=Willisornis vidua TaxID=1566151 RepID=A0ABQ9DCB5_9PASS|nr:hypothetical protein WISP_55458 [Willisornis vidua]
MALVPCQVLRAAILLSYCSILCNYKAIDMPAHQTYGGSWKFLTFIDLLAVCGKFTWTFPSKHVHGSGYFYHGPKGQVRPVSDQVVIGVSIASILVALFSAGFDETPSNCGLVNSYCPARLHSPVSTLVYAWRLSLLSLQEKGQPSIELEVIQAVFFGICVLTDLSSLLTRGNDSQEQERQLKKLISLRDWMMAVLAFPVGVFVVTMFWSIYIYDRELVYPKLLDNFIPAWLNHGMMLSTETQCDYITPFAVGIALVWFMLRKRQGTKQMLRV